MHIHALDNDEFQRHVRFRDYLRANPDAAREYEALKRRLAAEAPEDWDHYVGGKGPLVREVLRKAYDVERNA